MSSATLGTIIQNSVDGERLSWSFWRTTSVWIFPSTEFHILWQWSEQLFKGCKLLSNCSWAVHCKKSSHFTFVVRKILKHLVILQRFCFLNLVRRNHSRSSWHRINHIGFVFCNSWESLIFQRSRMHFVEVSWTDLGRVETGLLDRTAYSNRLLLNIK